MGLRGQSWRPDRPAQNGMELLEFSPRTSEPPGLQARPQDLFGPRRARHTEEQAACRRQPDGEIAEQAAAVLVRGERRQRRERSHGRPLEYCGEFALGRRVIDAVRDCIAAGERTADLGGPLDTDGFTKAVIKRAAA